MIEPYFTVNADDNAVSNIDINGKNPSNTYGDDVYVFGLGEFGIVK